MILLCRRRRGVELQCGRVLGGERGKKKKKNGSRTKHTTGLCLRSDTPTGAAPCHWRRMLPREHGTGTTDKSLLDPSRVGGQDGGRGQDGARDSLRQLCTCVQTIPKPKAQLPARCRASGDLALVTSDLHFIQGKHVRLSQAVFGAATVGLSMQAAASHMHIHTPKVKYLGKGEGGGAGGAGGSNVMQQQDHDTSSANTYTATSTLVTSTTRRPLGPMTSMSLW